MIELYFAYELTEEQLRNYCKFDDEDIDIGNQSQIDFILVSNEIVNDVPYPIERQINCLPSIQYYENKTIFIFWH
jgi:hypothetical protein